MKEITAACRGSRITFGRWICSPSHEFLDIEDALIVAHMENRGLQELLSYDADFDRVAGVTRQEL